MMITGATSGIGLATAHSLAKYGCNLIITGRREKRLNQIKINLEQTGVEVVSLCFDIQDKTQIEKTLSQNKSVLKQVSVLINNAGMAKGVDPIDKAELEDWEQMIDTNIKGLLYMTHYMLPHLKQHGSADIINIGSVSGRWTYPGGAVYCGTKHAVRAISEGMRQDLCGSNIKVCCIEPGLVETEFSVVRLEDEQKANAVYAGARVLQANDIADTIVWTLQRPAHVNIQEMVIFPIDQGGIAQVNRV
ncbi:MAG: SDR family NAD(P)-dependent oxidoreductase [Halobacteriovoraceae bacterium]|nr:SDR family NAD(P)-dependent oxidoreductase [Halobacteriovoraceae bacterium]